jgi:[ribosomal protein S5]-alanine N-acetyltransferase
VKDPTVETQPIPEMVTAKLRLRSVSLSDAQNLSVLMTSGISRWLASWDYPLSVEAATKRIEELQDRAMLKEALPYMIVDRRTEQAIGWISVQRSTSSARRGELSYWIGEEHQGKGYAQEAVSAMLPSAAEHLNLALIEAGAQVENGSSFAVMIRCGMIPRTERLVYAPTRACNELCRFYEWMPRTSAEDRSQKATFS